MPMFRKLPVTVDAVQWVGPGLPDAPAWAVEAAQYGVIKVAGGRVEVSTVDGVLSAEPGDWIVKGAEGEIYPVKADIFAASYEAVS